MRVLGMKTDGFEKHDQHDTCAVEQFERTFRYFVRDETNMLSLAEFSAMLASLGMLGA